MASSLHDFSLPALIEGQVNFADFKGRKVLLVNVASKCGLTPQYEQLEALYREHAQDKFVIVGCPANNFGSQEPGTAAEIAEFCSATYGVSFPMTAKISVKGADQHPLYAFATQSQLNGKLDSEVTWNFQKYLFDEAGQLVQTFSPQTQPLDPSLLEALGVVLA